MKTTYYQNKVAVVTGGSSGIGLALAKALTQADAQVCILARTPERLEAARKEIDAASLDGKRCLALQTDVASYEQVETAIRQVEANWGTVDFLFNCAGVAYPGYFADQPLEIFREMMEIEYFGKLNTLKAVLPGMLARGQGHIISMGSSASFLGFFGYSSYVSAKFAVRGLSDALRHELKPKGIKVSIVFPTDTDTPQLKYDKEHRPPELAAMMNLLSGSMPPEKVASGILHGVERGQYIILPGFDSKLVFWLVTMLGPLVYPLMDFLRAFTTKRANLKA